MPLDRRLRPLPFHDALCTTLQSTEPGLWKWFSSDGYGAQYVDCVRLELLRSTYRMPQTAHEKLYAMAGEVAAGFGIDRPITLYQAQEDGALNAALVFVPTEVHVVLRGPVTQTLSELELRALMGHELAHHRLWTEEAGKYHVAETLIEHVAGAPQSAPSHVQTALRHRRWTEIYADRGALVACDDLSAAVGCLVKMTTGLREVDADSYILQADEAIGAAAKSSEGITHPEPFIRAFALRAWHRGDDEDAVRRLIEGPLDLDTLDLVQQRELTDRTSALIEAVLVPEWMRTEATLAHARRFFPNAAFGGKGDLPSGDWSESLCRYFAYVLLDFGMADPDIEEMSLARVTNLAHTLGIGPMFAKVARKELRISAATFASIERRGAELDEKVELEGEMS